MNKFLQDIKSKILVFDGSKGTMLQNMGLTGEECPELWNLEHPQKVKALYTSYVEAGSDVIQTNTFGANRAILEKFNLHNEVNAINSAGVKLAKEAAGEKIYVAASIGPTGKLLEPSGDLAFEQAYEIFKEQVISVTQAGADFINFETITDLTEMRAAILAARENSPLPILASMTFESNYYTLMGNNPVSCALVCQSLGVDLIGANCSSGPEFLLEIIKKFHSFSSLPISVKANAGLPEYSGGNISYNETPETFKNSVQSFIQSGVRLIGGCCGTTPEFISAIKQELSRVSLESLNKINRPNAGSLICSSSKYIDIEDIKNINIGSFINESNMKEFNNNLDNNNFDMVIDIAIELSSSDFQVLYFNLDLIEQTEALVPIIKIIQTYSRLPIIFESTVPPSLEPVLRAYNGKAGVVIKGINNYTFDLIITSKKYGSSIIDKSFVV